MVLANEPLVYREVISATIRALRPRFEVFTKEPGELDRELPGLGRRLVGVCSRPTALVEREALAWVQLYPNHGPHTLVALGGQGPRRYAHMDLDALIGVLDAAERLLCQRGPHDVPGVR